MDMTLERAVYSPKEAQVLLCVSHATLYRMIAEGRIDARKIGSKTVITKKSIEQLLDSLPSARRARPADAA